MTPNRTGHVGRLPRIATTAVAVLGLVAAVCGLIAIHSRFDHDIVDGAPAARFARHVIAACIGHFAAAGVNTVFYQRLTVHFRVGVPFGHRRDGLGGHSRPSGFIHGQSRLFSTRCY